MLAHHPETGQPIRILRSDAAISQDGKTLTWIRPSFKPSVRWSRWSTVVTEPDALPILAGQTPTACVIQKPDPAWLSIAKASATTDMVVVASRPALVWLEREGVDIGHMLGIHELFDLYPYLGEPVSDSDHVEKVVISIAHILRHTKLAAHRTAQEDFGVRAQLAAWVKHLSGHIVDLAAEATDAIVPECWLVQQYFKHSLPRRAREIWGTLERNIRNPYIDRILLLNESLDFELPKSDKLVVRHQPNRLTYADVLRAIQRELPEGAFAMFGNADIWFDETLRYLWSIRLEEQRLFLALLRWEENEGAAPTLFGPRSDSQDAWILAKRTVDFEVTDADFGFPFGKPGCDNAITVAMLRRKCLVVNPAYTIITHHQHASNIRNYNPRDILYKPAYLYVDPTPIHSVAVDNVGSTWICKEYQSAWGKTAPKTSFARQLHPVVEGTGKMVCEMLRRTQEGSSWVASGANMWTPDPAPRPLYEWHDGAFVTGDGLVSDFQKVMVGKHEVWRKGWENASVSSMTPALHIPYMLSVAGAQTNWSSLSNWVLTQLPTVLRTHEVLLSEGAKTLPEFLVPALDSVAPFLYDCVWPSRHVGTFPYMPNTQYYTNHLLVAAPPTGGPRVTREDVERLRSLLPLSASSFAATKGVLVLCVSDRSDAVCTPGWAEEVQACHGELLKGWTVLVIHEGDKPRKRREAFQRATWIVGERAALEWIWMARHETRVIECTHEGDIQDTILHLAGAADCFYIPHLMKREPVEFQREHALVDVGRAIKLFGFQTLLQASLPEEADRPLLIVPDAKAFQGTMWAHSGDSFREMIDVWVSRGYCRKELSPHTGLCWWGGIGETVLFDWDTPRWWYTHMPNYRLALFGNAVPPGPAGHEGRQSVWSMWPRHPALLESFVSEKALRGWQDRSLSSLFLGKVENGVQKEYRCCVDWSEAVELFSMPLDSTGAPYPYTPLEYLDRVADSRFGLCLRGFGPKCNREIEYMALGTVPIVTEDVDITHFLSPPREGIHFFRAKTPADVKRIVAETSEETWSRMSAACHAWWRENASAEGLFRLTWARIQQCAPYLTAGVLPAWPPRH